MSKRIYWAPRTVTLTSDRIFLAKVDAGGTPRDELDLLDLTTVQSWDWKEVRILRALCVCVCVCVCCVCLCVVFVCCVCVCARVCVLVQAGVLACFATLLSP